MDNQLAPLPIPVFLLADESSPKSYSGVSRVGSCKKLDDFFAFPNKSLLLFVVVPLCRGCCARALYVLEIGDLVRALTQDY